MYPTVFFNTIIIETPLERIYRRLGYRRGVTRLETSQAAEVEKYIAEAVALIRLRGVGRRVSLREINAELVVLEGLAGDVVLYSRQLATFFRGCNEALLLGATAGEEIMTAIADDFAGDRLTRGVVIDATASELVDASLDWIMSYFSRDLRRENKALTKNRFSAGYGDFHLENQQAMFSLLALDKIGVKITADFVLIPEKSVTAMAGIKVN